MESSTTLPLTSLPDDWSTTEQESWRELERELAAIRSGKSVVLVTGVFDLFHEEHQQFLRQAKAAGDILVVALESDSRVHVLKGPDRPIQNQATRLQQVQGFSGVDFALVLPESFFRPEHHRALVHLLRPSILAVSSHSPHLEKKQAILREVGGEVKVVYEHNPLVSTTELIKRRTIPQ